MDHAVCHMLKSGVCKEKQKYMRGKKVRWGSRFYAPHTHRRVATIYKLNLDEGIPALGRPHGGETAGLELPFLE